MSKTPWKALVTLSWLVAGGLAVPLLVVPTLGSLGSPQLVTELIANDTPTALASPAKKSKKQKAGFLNCSAVRERTRDYLKLHYSVRKFDEEISARTFSKFFQILDPGKNFFLQSDIDSFATLDKKLGDLVKQTDCRFVQNVSELFLKRVSESEALIKQALEKKPDFTTEDYLETDRKKIAWGGSTGELQERWQKLLKFNAMSMMETEKDWVKVKERLEKRYFLIRKSLNEKNEDEFNGLFLNAFAVSLDPHSSYYMPEDQDDFKVAFSLQLVGIGASLSQQDGYTVVEAIIAGGAAMRDGRIKKGDKIIAVDSGDGSGVTDVVDMDLSKVVSLIRGKKDTQVSLHILRKNETGQISRVQIELVRDIVHLADQEAHSDVMTVQGKRIGVVNLPSFYIDYAGSRSGDDYRSSANDMKREILKLKKQNVDGIVVDLRRNGGGDLGECIKLTGLFIDKGPVVQVQSSSGDVESADDRDGGVTYSGPLAVLISKQSASASEIFAGAMQDYGRALILGDSRTYGKATVQNVIEVPGSMGRESDGAVKVTISKFFRPSGRSNQAIGVPSDVAIPDIFELADVSEGENDYVLPHTEIAPQKSFRPLLDLSPFIATLKTRSTERVNKDAEFKKLFEAMEKVKKEKENTRISLKIDSDKDKQNKNDPSKKDDKDDKKNKDAHEKSDDALAKKNSEEENESKVINPKDIQLKEAGQILADAIELMPTKKSWTPGEN